jgi:hypothetical protein
MFGKEPRLTVPPDVAASLDLYAAKLSASLNMPVTRQQAFERMVRLFGPKEGATNGQ